MMEQFNGSKVYGLESEAWYGKLGFVLDGNLPDELSLMTTYLMNGLLDKGINKMWQNAW